MLLTRSLLHCRTRPFFFSFSNSLNDSKVPEPSSAESAQRVPRCSASIDGYGNGDGDGEEMSGPIRPKLVRLLYFVGAGFICTIAINKWRYLQGKQMIHPSDKTFNKINREAVD